MAFQCISNFQFAWSCWAIAIIAYSRFDLIVNVLDPKFNRNRFWGLAVVSWLVSLLTTLLPFMGWSSVGFVRIKHVFKCGVGDDARGLLHAFYLPFFYFINFLVPSVLVIICFSRVVCMVGRHRRSRNNSQSSMQNIVVLTSTDISSSWHACSSGHLKEKTLRDRIKDTIQSKALRYIVIIVLSNLLLLSPFVCLRSYDSVCTELGAKRRIPAIFLNISSFLFMFNFNVNAFLYIFWIRTFQQATFAMICCSHRDRPEPRHRHKSTAKQQRHVI